ncbi:hypothetical protein BDB00DRAFT_868878 [Zychaea mexicana]|uniref:uncharacterized protein n=1 Tax=Zychaea mexicana TaxID=64656 RepID=UPI0022FF091E|nr:uncharacterized protein BDB00DRAFT_868878 [Zychaea mexicana]KAI9497044.1 hypothetical protein BDB00DRAFT_868878 [Zychaea mexicana]
MSSPSLCLYQLPPELLQQILHRLPRSSLAQLCLTAQRFYELCLPKLYRHLNLSFRSHIHQLEMGLQHRPLLRDTVARHTKELTLVCRQSGSNMSDLTKLLPKLPHVHTLTFVDFHVLFTESVCQLALYCRHLQTLQFRYCNLVSTTHNIHALLASPLKRVNRLSMVWTDFSETALSQLLSCLPDLTTIDLGANHNRIRTANDSALTALTQHCFHIRNLAVSLQHIEQESLCDVLAFYGNQFLSIRCGSSPRILGTVATFCSHVVHLSLRAAGRQRQKSHALEHVLRQCTRLRWLELSGWLIQDIPSVVWSVIARKRRLGCSSSHSAAAADGSGSRSHGNNSSSSSSSSAGDRMVDNGDWQYYLDDAAMLQQRSGDIQYRQVGNLKKTLILDSQELYEIRNRLA